MKVNRFDRELNLHACEHLEIIADRAGNVV